MRTVVYLILASIGVCASLSLSAEVRSVRWTYKEDTDSDLNHILSNIQRKTGIQLSATDFMLVESRRLAHTYFTMLIQMAGKLPIRSNYLRIWTSLKTGEALQVEARVVELPARSSIEQVSRERRLSSESTIAIIRGRVKSHWENNEIRSVEWQDVWEKGAIVRVVNVKGKKGRHVFVLSLPEGEIQSEEYQPFPQADRVCENNSEEVCIPVQIFPIYEQSEDGKTLPRIPSVLRYIKRKVRGMRTDPYAALRKFRFLESKMDPVLGLTVEGRKQGFWAMNQIKAQAAFLYNQLPFMENNFQSGVILQGRYTTVNLHPDVTKVFKQLTFSPGISAVFKPDWKPSQENFAVAEMTPGAALLGRPLTDPGEAFNRRPRRLVDNDAAAYIEDGFDEIQVYWAVNQMFDSLRSMGFTDPELSTRPFHAFLYDPDVTYRDNAFYTDDTINFTTYSPSERNMARDNSTIWHELGHGVMDRLMGDQVKLADTGGLSEGMADFVAQFVLNDITAGMPYEGKEKLRIFNNTGFYLTNEVHDDGEAYGGAMNDLLVEAMRIDMRKGLAKIVDLTLETMRFTRNHPALTANDWFEHMLFADEVGNPPFRGSGELREIILKALSGRNFNSDGSAPASFQLLNGNDEVTARGPGSRPNPILLTIKPEEKKTFQLQVRLRGTSSYPFSYPAKVTVQLSGGPLQGSVHWEGKDKSPIVHKLLSERDTAKIPLTVTGKCDRINLLDGGCMDYAYIQIWQAQHPDKPVAKKRFYLRIKNPH